MTSHTDRPVYNEMEKEPRGIERTGSSHWWKHRAPWRGPAGGKCLKNGKRMLGMLVHSTSTGEAGTEPQVLSHYRMKKKLLKMENSSWLIIQSIPQASVSFILLSKIYILY